MRSSDWISDVGSSDRILKVGFPGRIYPVNPKYPEIGGLTCHSSIEALPEAPDVALISLAAAKVPDALRTLGRMGTRAAVVLSSGFEERSEEHTSELQSLMRISYAVFCLKKKKNQDNNSNTYNYI